jgi:hypothetical protein
MSGSPVSVLDVLLVQHPVGGEDIVEVVDDGEGGFADGVFVGEGAFVEEPGGGSDLREFVVDNVRVVGEALREGAGVVFA